MYALRRIRRLSTAAPRKEYPTSFISHLRTQKLNVFNIGVAFLTLSLSSQMVSYKQRFEAAVNDKEKLVQKVEVLEKLVLDLGGHLPDDDSKKVDAMALHARDDTTEALASSSAEEIKSKKYKLI
ncbi:hypothetical protein Plhal304r1_c024g0083431 [Plasmopara halstedii]